MKKLILLALALAAFGVAAPARADVVPVKPKLPPAETPQPVCVEKPEPDEDGGEAGTTYRYYDGFPVRWCAPDLLPDAASTGIETVEIAFERLEKT